MVPEGRRVDNGTYHPAALLRNPPTSRTALRTCWRCRPKSARSASTPMTAPSCKKGSVCLPFLSSCKQVGAFQKNPAAGHQQQPPANQGQRVCTQQRTVGLPTKVAFQQKNAVQHIDTTMEQCRWPDTARAASQPASPRAHRYTAQGQHRHPRPGITWIIQTIIPAHTDKRRVPDSPN